MKLFIAGTSLLVALMLTTLTALAGDFAEREVLGFSPNGKLFAFEEYGRQDGSGFPYSNIFIIDTDTDKWTAGSPFRVRLDYETKSVRDAREQSRIMAGTVLKSFEGRGLIAGSNKPTELSGNPRVMIVNPRLVVPPIDETLELRVAEKKMPPTKLCEFLGPSTGFMLTKIGGGSDTPEILHDDKKVPNSRGCPIEYSIADIVTYYPESAQPKFAAIILMKTHGFEGPDGRYLAVTGSLN